MTMIDYALVSVDWDLLNPDTLLQALSSSVSDHAPPPNSEHGTQAKAMFLL
jgi:hypothetical protein